MAKVVKCTNCGKPIDPKLAYIVEKDNIKHRYCKECYDGLADAAVTIDEEAVNRAKINELLIDICHGNTDYLPALSKQVKMFEEEYDTDSRFTLKLFDYLKKVDTRPLNRFQPDYGIKALLSHYYPQAKKYYAEIDRLNATPVDYILDCLKETEEIETVTIPQSYIKSQDEVYKEKLNYKMFGPRLSYEELLAEDEEWEAELAKEENK